MKYRILIGLSIVLLLLAVILISRDLFRAKPSLTASCCDDETMAMKQFDTTRLGFYRKTFWETGIKGLTGISVGANRVVVSGNKEIAIFDTTGKRTGGFYIDTIATCTSVFDDAIFVGTRAVVTQFDFTGKKILSFRAPYKNSYITSVAVDDKYVFVADAGKKRVLKFSKEGILIQEIGRKDTAAGSAGFVIPSPYFDIALGGFNDLWVVNPGRLKLENYSTAGFKRSDWGDDLSDDNRFTGCCNPAHFALLPDGSFITYEKGNDKIKMFDNTGQFRSMVAGAGSFKGKPDFLLGKNNLVKDLATDASGSIYILDAYNRINVYKPVL